MIKIRFLHSQRTSSHHKIGLGTCTNGSIFLPNLSRAAAALPLSSALALNSQFEFNSFRYASSHSTPPSGVHPRYAMVAPASASCSSLISLSPSQLLLSPHPPACCSPPQTVLSPSLRTPSRPAGVGQRHNTLVTEALPVPRLHSRLFLARWRCSISNGSNSLAASVVLPCSTCSPSLPYVAIATLSMATYSDVHYMYIVLELYTVCGEPRATDRTPRQLVPAGGLLQSRGLAAVVRFRRLEAFHRSGWTHLSLLYVTACRRRLLDRLCPTGRRRRKNPQKQLFSRQKRPLLFQTVRFHAR